LYLTTDNHQRPRQSSAWVWSRRPQDDRVVFRLPWQRPWWREVILVTSTA